MLLLGVWHGIFGSARFCKIRSSGTWLVKPKSIWMSKCTNRSIPNLSLWISLKAESLWSIMFFFGSRVKQWTQAASCWSSIDGTCSKVFPKLTIVSRKGPPHWQYLAWKWWHHFRVCPELGYVDHGIPKWRECFIGKNNDKRLYLWGTKPKKSLQFELWCRPVWCSKSPVAVRVTKLRL